MVDGVDLDLLGSNIVLEPFTLRQADRCEKADAKDKLESQLDDHD